MPFKRNGFILKRKRNIVWDELKVVNLCKVLMNDTEVRKSFSKKYEVVLRESGILHEEMPLEILPNKGEFTHPKNCESYKQQKFYKLKNRQLIERIISNTVALKQLVQKLIDGQVFDNGETYQICWKCDKVLAGVIHERCPKCKGQLELFETYRVPYTIEDVWQQDHRKFLEGLCYNSIKLERLPSIKMISAGTEIGELGEKYYPYTDLDVSIAFNKPSIDLKNKTELVILCTYNPRLGSEKKRSTKNGKTKLPLYFCNN